MHFLYQSLVSSSVLLYLNCTTIGKRKVTVDDFRGEGGNSACQGRNDWCYHPLLCMMHLSPWNTDFLPLDEGTKKISSIVRIGVLSIANLWVRICAQVMSVLVRNLKCFIVHSFLKLCSREPSNLGARTISKMLRGLTISSTVQSNEGCAHKVSG